MKQHALIIDVRDQLPWHRRYLSTTTTALLWVAWLLLWRPIMILLGFTDTHHHNVAYHLLLMFMTALEKGVMLLMICAVLLLLWNNFVPYKPKKKLQANTDMDYANHFGLVIQDLQQSRSQKISTVHHDEHGKIIKID
ncbi:poly-beta-1,6-N-acetyl-D-glucosamine biosynthesis protein PgaD [Acinetobacter qingfengensis]|uniref:Poly-beta-1,6-N-acetyl-D-glucosamine biosynthesis protein PgaD n=1 Tax=Acinetobacter qingfengensis TaxID=1262585 RepID=A0A1E7RD83_9GAMM|nr:poly-beta-1,6-N-acetyl-D-glucosamine biosynthesis protein PgaD [Acinetobacter qingfengensis]KAA8735351.1 poly-beta-1,6-N-acetyl-D-glucosamine biosynthesis protein PgaD [Acinetobacter qingfengensis]OEY97324.1 poly-beta-1,6-N-acetyl-D-glucosamine biosynthesis protein PgaD [Acinetobacter qingfengensis]